MEVAKPARRRPHPQGCNEEEDGRDAVFWSAASARNGAARGKNCGKRSAGRCGYEATGRLTSIMRGSVGPAALRMETLATERLRRLGGVEGIQGLRMPSSEFGQLGKMGAFGSAEAGRVGQTKRRGRGWGREPGNPCGN